MDTNQMQSKDHITDYNCTALRKPKALTCAAIFAARLGFMAIAPIAVGIGMLTGAISKGPKVKGQWDGAAIDKDGFLVYDVEVESVKISGKLKAFWSIYQLVDDPGIGLYEATVAKIYHKFGWAATVYYQLALRNVAQGWPAKFAVKYVVPVSAKDRTWKTIFGIRYGWKQYRDWVAERETGVARYYSVPDFFVSAEDAGEVAG